MESPTIGQIEYAIDMIIKLGYNLDDYDFTKMSKQDVSDLIKELAAEVENHANGDLIDVEVTQHEEPKQIEQQAVKQPEVVFNVLPETELEASRVGGATGGSGKVEVKSAKDIEPDF